MSDMELFINFCFLQHDFLLFWSDMLLENFSWKEEDQGIFSLLRSANLT